MWSASGFAAKELRQLGSEVGGVGRVLLFGDDLAAVFLELRHGVAPDALGVVGLLADGGQIADAVRPENVARVDAHLDVTDLGAENVVAGVGDVRIAGQSREQDHAVRLGERRHPEHRAAAGSPKYDLDSVHVGELVVGVDRVLRVALGIFDDEFQHAPVDAAGGVDLVEGHLLGLNGHRAVGLTGARLRLHNAYPKRSLVALAVAGDRGQRQDHR